MMTVAKAAFLILFYFTIFTSALSCSSTQRDSDREKATYHLQLGTGHIQNQRYPAALRELLNAERLDPQNLYVQNNLGIAYYLRGHLGLAQKHLEKAIKIEPRYTDARNNLGRVYIDLKKYDLAIEQLRIAEKDLTYPQPEKTYLNLGISYFHKKDFKLAQEALLKSLHYQRDNCYSNALYGRTLYELKEFETSAATLDRAVGFCKKEKFDEPHFFSALSYLKLRQADKARSRFREILSLYPNSAYAKRSRELLETIQ